MSSIVRSVIALLSFQNYQNYLTQILDQSNFLPSITIFEAEKVPFKIFPSCLPLSSEEGKFLEEIKYSCSSERELEILFNKVNSNKKFTNLAKISLYEKSLDEYEITSSFFAVDKIRVELGVLYTEEFKYFKFLQLLDDSANSTFFRENLFTKINKKGNLTKKKVLYFLNLMLENVKNDISFFNFVENLSTSNELNNYSENENNNYAATALAVFYMNHFPNKINSFKKLLAKPGIDYSLLWDSFQKNNLKNKNNSKRNYFKYLLAFYDYFNEHENYLVTAMQYNNDISLVHGRFRFHLINYNLMEFNNIFNKFSKKENFNYCTVLSYYNSQKSPLTTNIIESIPLSYCENCSPKLVEYPLVLLDEKVNYSFTDFIVLFFLFYFYFFINCLNYICLCIIYSYLRDSFLKENNEVETLPLNANLVNRDLTQLGQKSLTNLVDKKNEFSSSSVSSTAASKNRENIDKVFKLCEKEKDKNSDQGENNKDRSLKVDSEIATTTSNINLVNRNLTPLGQEWLTSDIADENCELSSSTMTSSSSSSSSKKEKWNQFQANEKLFSVNSTNYDENLYTTKLDLGNISKDQQKEAARIAGEIKNQRRKKHYSKKNSKI